MEIFKNGIRKSKGKVLKVILIIICLFLIYSISLYFYNFRNSKVNSLQKLSDILRIDLYDDINSLNDIDYNCSRNETEIIIYYNITDTILNEKQYYQYSNEYNPLPSSTDSRFINLINDFIEKNCINSSDIIYTNTIFSEYHIYNLIGKLSIPFEIHIYIIKTKDDNVFEVVVSAVVPYKLQMNIDY